MASQPPGDGCADDAAAGDDDVEVRGHGRSLFGQTIQFESCKVTSYSFALRDDLRIGRHLFDGLFELLGVSRGRLHGN
jgi:hypothetical protein